MNRDIGRKLILYDTESERSQRYKKMFLVLNVRLHVLFCIQNIRYQLILCPTTGPEAMVKAFSGEYPAFQKPLGH